MKRSHAYTLSAVLALSFLVVTSLAIVCSYHHGIDGLDQRQQSASHGTLYCPSLSKVSGVALMIASLANGFALEGQQQALVQPSCACSCSVVQNPLARSPPSTILT